MSYSFNIPFKVERGGGWTNPYITDGLVAMWDGEWNAGGGVHDSTATQWKDIAGDNDLTEIVVIAQGSGYRWTENGFALDKSRIRFRKPNSTIDFLTMEIVGTYDAANQSIFGGGNYAGLSRYGSYFTIPNQTTPLKCNKSAIANSSLSISYDFSNELMYRSGSQITTGTITAGNYYALGEIYIGNVSSYASTGETKCVRLYNRALTSAEIAANYAVDKERFNLS